jgi:hypothetical protein
MGRKHTAGSVGNQGVGGVQVDNTTLSAADDLDITIDPSGTGIFKIAGDAQLQGQGDLRFADADSSNWVAFQAPSTIASNVTWTLPAADGTNGQALTTNASGTLSFVTPTVSITNETSDSGTNYIAFTTATTGSISTARVSNTGLTFQPSTGTVSATAGTFGGTVISLRLENTKTTNHSLELADRDRVVNMNNTSPATVTVPTDSTVAFAVGSVVYINRINTGSVTLAAAAGVTLSKTGTFKLNEEIFCRKRAANNWIVVDTPTALTATGGSLSASSGYTIHTYTSGSSSFII